MSGLPELGTNLIATLTSLNWNEFTHGWNREQVWTGRLGDWLVPKGKHMCHNLQSNIQVAYLKHLQHVGNEIKKIFLYFIRVGPVGLMELWRVVHREGVCSKWANLFPLLSTWWPFCSLKDKWSERRSSCLAGSRQIEFRSRQDRDVHRHAKDCNC